MPKFYRLIKQIKQGKKFRPKNWKHFKFLENHYFQLINSDPFGPVIVLNDSHIAHELGENLRFVDLLFEDFEIIGEIESSIFDESMEETK
jgi:hypothetical protein